MAGNAAVARVVQPTFNFSEKGWGIWWPIAESVETNDYRFFWNYPPNEGAFDTCDFAITVVPGFHHTRVGNGWMHNFD